MLLLSLVLLAHKVFSSPVLYGRISLFPIGSSVVRSLLADGTFTPRAVTRNPNSEKALEIKQLGAEVVQGDLWDVSSLKDAMNGAEAVFGVTFISFVRISWA